VYAVGLVSAVAVTESGVQPHFLVKLGLYVGLLAALSTISWGDPLYLARRGRSLAKTWALGPAA
jgi:hypothetical protein